MAGSDEARVVSERRGDATVVAPRGDVDLARSPALREALRQAHQSRPRRVVVDLSGVDYMDSSGVATLVEALQMARRQSSVLVLCNMKERVRSIFEIARLDTVFSIVGTVDDAVAG